MVRFYGEKPYRAAVIHGGPGDIGGMQPVAEHLGKMFGVMEPIQSQYTTIALVMELRRQLGLHIKEPITLIGHSWGAWLSLLVASCYPFLVERVILVGCPPLEEIYVGHIHERRMKRLPLEGIINPLDSLCIPYRLQILQKCGHAPFDEKFAEERFYQVLEQILRS